MTYRPKKFFVFSLEPWGDMWYSKHHYAAHLAKEHDVYFVSLPDRWRWKDLFSFSVKIRKVAGDIKVVEYRNNLPVNVLPPILRNFINGLNALKLRRLCGGGEVLFWCFHPTEILNGNVLRRPGAKVIYHVVDPYQNLPNDSHFAKRADLIVAINPWYLKYYKDLNGNCILIPHGVRKEDRITNEEAVQASRKRWGRYAILATGVNRFLNYRMLLMVARRFPSLRLLIAGHFFPMRSPESAEREELFKLPNVTYIGVKHPDELKDIVKGATIGLLTYRFEVTRSVPVKAGRTPLKVLTYLAQHCPVVSTNNSFVPTLDNKGYYKAENEEHFLSLVDRILNGDLAVDASTVDTYLDSVEYGKLIDQVLSYFQPATDQRVEVLDPELQSIPSVQNERKKIPAHSPILIVSNEEWNGPRYSKHRYALALSAYREVFFIDPAPKWVPSHLFHYRIRERTTPEGITVLSYHNVVPLFGGILGGINDWMIASKLRGYFHKKLVKDPVLWTFDPSRLSSPRQLKTVVAIYHCADDHSFRMRGEKLLAQRCDHVFCIARGLMDRFENLNPSVHHVPHGVSEEDLVSAPIEPSNIPAAPGFGLYIGNINDRHDFALWKKLIQKYPERDWVVVGPMMVRDPIGLELLERSTPRNLHYLGPVSYTKLRQLIAASGFGFLYMKPDDPANRISSQKVVQFLALGKTFFCSWFSEYEDKQDLVYMSDDHDTALEQVQQFMTHGETHASIERRLRYVESLRYDRIIEDLPFLL